MSWLFMSGGQSIGASASASVPPTNIQGVISFRVDWFDLLAIQETLKSLLHFLFIGTVANNPGEGNGTPLQYSWLENPMDGGVW